MAIAICTPARDVVYASFAYDLVNLIKTSPEALFTISLGSILSNQRQALVQKALDAKVSHILWIDSDMRFPPNTLEMLLQHKLDIVGVNCRHRNSNQFTARKADKFINSYNKKGVEEVDIIGFGVTLVKADVFKSIPRPWFAMPWDGDKHVGEDVYFCTTARENGYKIYVDHDLSSQVRHAGTVEFGVN